MKTNDKQRKQYMVEIFTPEALRLYAEDKLSDTARMDIEALIKSDDRAARYLAEIELRLGRRATAGHVAATPIYASQPFGRIRPKRSGQKQ